MAYENSVGKFLNEDAPPLPGQLDNFDDDARPDNELLENGVDYREEYYQEDATVFRKLGLPEGAKKGEDGESEDADAGILSGTSVGDAFEAGHKFKLALSGEDTGRNLYEGAMKAWAAAADVKELASIGSDLVSGRALAIFDPFNFVGGLLMGWMLEHVEPMRKSLDSLAGNPDMVSAYSDSWANISERLTEVAATWSTEVKQGTAAWTGAAANAYRAKADAHMASIATQAALADSLSKVNKKMGELVDGVRGIVTEILNSLAGVLVEIAAILIASAGTASPALIARAVFEISTATMSVSRMLLKLTTALISLGALLREMMKIVTAVTQIELEAAKA
ncbi:hypothetical protein ACQPZ2_25445 [Nocardia pseudovaccinii]|uniref:WXG100-like domain-containing protein n=1 Tax=Nocardia pseudovaccinii TaxID=189540 RepID=UPI003D89ECA2